MALKASAEIEETKRYLTRLIESSPDAIIATDKNGTVVLFNEGAETLLGYRAEEVIGRPTTGLYDSEERAKNVLIEMRKRGGTASGYESVLKAKDGRSVPVLISASVLLDKDGQEAGMVGFATDLRARKHEEEELRKAHDELEKRVEERTTELKGARERLRYLMTVTPAIVYTNQASDYTCTFVSENVSRIMGFSAWEMLEDKDFWTVRLHPEDAKSVFEEMAPLIEKGGGTIEYRFRHRDGHYIWIQDTFRVIRDAQGRPSEIVGSWADISDRKGAEEALGERMAVMNDLETLVGASPAIIYTTQVSGDYACTFVSENLNAIMAYSPWEMRDDKKFWVKRLHPDDANRVFAELERLVGQGHGALEYRFRHRDGHYIWIQDTFSVTHDADGKPKEIVGSWADMSDRKRVEAELKRLAEQVELRNRFIRETFGRYLTDEVVDTVLESPSGLQMGGEKRKLTMMMTDLRGFTSLSERLPADRVVKLLNRYLATMVPIIKQYQGTIDEFIGDAIFVLFGAPVWHEDDAERAVACAVAMQIAMERGQRGEPQGGPARGRDGHRHSHRSGGARQYRLARAHEIRRGGKQREPHLAHPGLHHRRPDPRLRDDAAGGRQQAQDRQADGGESQGRRASRGPVRGLGYRWAPQALAWRDRRHADRTQGGDSPPLRGRGIEPGGRRSIEGRPDQGLAEGRRGAACQYRPALEQSQDASRRTATASRSPALSTARCSVRCRERAAGVSIRFTSISPEIEVVLRRLIAGGETPSPLTSLSPGGPEIGPEKSATTPWSAMGHKRTLDRGCGCPLYP